MNAHSATGHQNAARSIYCRLVAPPRGLWAAFITWRVQRAAIRQLKSMTDNELEDIGLLRSQIEDAVMGERACDHQAGRQH